MSYDCWSVSAELLDSNTLARNSDNEMEIARLDGLPSAVVLTAKVALKSTDVSAPPSGDSSALASVLAAFGLKSTDVSPTAPPPWEYSVVMVSLYFGTALVDRSWSNVLRTNGSGATTVSLHGTIDVRPTTTTVTSTGSRHLFNTAYLRVYHNGFSFEFDNVWIIALPLSSLVHTGPFPKK